MSPAENPTQISDLAMRMNGSRQLLVAQMDMFVALVTLGQYESAEGMRNDLHAQVDGMLDNMAAFARTVRNGANLS